MKDPGGHRALEGGSRWMQHRGVHPERPLTQRAKEPRMWFNSSLTGHWESRLPLRNLPSHAGAGVCPSLPPLPPSSGTSRESQVAWPSV